MDAFFLGYQPQGGWSVVSRRLVKCHVKKGEGRTNEVVEDLPQEPISVFCDSVPVTVSSAQPVWLIVHSILACAVFFFQLQIPTVFHLGSHQCQWRCRTAEKGGLLPTGSSTESQPRQLNWQLLYLRLKMADSMPERKSWICPKPELPQRQTRAQSRQHHS